MIFETKREINTRGIKLDRNIVIRADNKIETGAEWQVT